MLGLEIELGIIFFLWFLINVVSCAERNRLLAGIRDALKRK